MKKLFAIVLCLAMCVGILAMTASADDTTYYVAGYSGLCNGKDWDCGAAENAMTPNADGTYSITYTNVPAGYYEFKVTDGTWNNCWPGSNYQLQLDKDGDVTITFDPATTDITVTSDAQGTVQAPEIVFMGIRGEGADGLSWSEDLVMTQVSEGIYEYTFESLPGGIWPNIKFTANGNWDDYDFGCADNTQGAVSGTAMEAVWKGSNIWFEVAEESKVTIRLDLTGFDYETKLGATYTVTVVPVTADEPVVEPDPSNPKSGDAVSLICALLAVSAVGAAIIIKKEF